MRRVLVAVIAFFFISLIIFSILYLAPDPYIIIDPPPSTPEQKERIIEILQGLGYEPHTLASLPGAYLSWIGEFFTGDWGNSIWDYSSYPK